MPWPTWLCGDKLRISRISVHRKNCPHVWMCGMPTGQVADLSDHDTGEVADLSDHDANMSRTNSEED